MSEIITRSFRNRNVRIENTEENQWFVVADIAKIIGHSDPGRLTEMVDDPDRKQIRVGVVTGKKADGTDAIQNVSVWAVNEYGLYEILIRSDKPEAKPFRHWITHEVLPKIRQNGFYRVEKVFKSGRHAETQQYVIENNRKLRERLWQLRTQITEYQRLAQGRELTIDGKTIEIPIGKEVSSISVSKTGVVTFRLTRGKQEIPLPTTQDPNAHPCEWMPGGLYPHERSSEESGPEPENNATLKLNA